MNEKFCILIISLFIIHVKTFEVDVTDKVIFTISIENDTIDNIEIGLFGKLTPKTVENFLTLSDGQYQGKSYNGTIFHRVIANFMIQGGDIINKDNNADDNEIGHGSISIYGKYFDDENFIINHGQSGLISMANSGKNTNGCQFFITLVPTPWLDGHHTVFGIVLNGMNLVYRIGSLPTDQNDRPKQMVKIIDIKLEKNVNIKTTLE